MTAAIVLAGGRGSRLGGVDKAAVNVGGRPLVDHVYAALDGCAPIIAVGPASIQRPGVHVVREDPPFGGPVAAIAAALDALGDVNETWLLACDLPRAERIVARLTAEEIGPDDGVVLVDRSGHVQWLAGRYRTSALRRAVAALPAPAGASMRRLLDELRLRTVDDPDDAGIDIDTPEDLVAFETPDPHAHPHRTKDSDR
ncbi:NTP transferase domain-containing protein [Gordonia sp. HY002]|uniref:molybdenum cofactor guanylyltransferase n=1 Tax=Gordonia zhenghanii TaxID=2911516 RepID=UPI001EF04F08|nr:NTP transferase domain-containing protein [Gordonia zhenghanii]MCF8571762.1 NTP transferase domain-containing protein [Gordonia zhenghanii]MCF8604913.1 NTP transferase domain-containing protein [Gordonia zhenghanii]